VETGTVTVVNGIDDAINVVLSVMLLSVSTTDIHSYLSIIFHRHLDALLLSGEIMFCDEVTISDPLTIKLMILVIDRNLPSYHPITHIITGELVTLVDGDMQFA